MDIPPLHSIIDNKPFVITTIRFTKTENIQTVTIVCQNRMTDISATLHTAHATAGPTFGFDFNHSYGKRANPCFFLRRELGQTKAELYASKQYRHCKIYRGGFLDYTTRQEFPTIESWVADCQSTIDCVMFGFNKFDGNPTYVDLRELLVKFKQVPDLVAELTDFVRRIEVSGLTLHDDVYIRQHNKAIVRYSEFMM